MAGLTKDYDERARNIQVNICCNSITDADIIEHLSHKDNKAGYIKALIRSDIKNADR